MGPGQKTNAIVSDDACFYYITNPPKNQAAILSANAV